MTRTDDRPDRPGPGRGSCPPVVPASASRPPSPDLQRRLRGITHVVLDMDGTIYRGGTVFPFTAPFLEQMRALGIDYTLLTNNPSRSSADYLTHLQQMGIRVEATELYTSAQATIGYLKRGAPRIRRIFALGTRSMGTEFERAGFELTRDDATDEPDAVVVGFDRTLTYERLCRAGWWIAKGKRFVATNPDLVCPTDEPTLLLDCGALCAALEKATGRRPDVVLGKPDPEMLQGIMDRHGLVSAQVAMVGDRLYTDIAMARRANVLGVLVLTGEATARDAAGEPSPDLVVPSLAELGAAIAAARQNTLSV